MTPLRTIHVIHYSSTPRAQANFPNIMVFGWTNERSHNYQWIQTEYNDLFRLQYYIKKATAMWQHWQHLHLQSTSRFPWIFILKSTVFTHYKMK